MLEFAIVNESEIATSKRGRQSTPITQDWYDFVDSVIANKGRYVSLPVSDERVKSTASVRATVKTICEEKGIAMSAKDKHQKGNVIQVASRMVKMNPRTGEDEYVPTPKDADETHTFVRYYTK